MMNFPERYKVMPGNLYSSSEYKLVPIRYEDHLDIMRWRNEQIHHLRQKELLSEEQQAFYFQNVIAKLFDEEFPNQILFSYLENNQCVGYGGLVHIDWGSKNAEISFIINPKLEQSSFEKHWGIYLNLLYRYAFEELNLHKIYTYAFDIRPHLYSALEKGGLELEARLKEHFLFKGKYKDVVIHCRKNAIFLKKEDNFLREADNNDAEIIFNWANESSVRKNSFNTNIISWEDHIKWFSSKLHSDESHIFLLHNKAINRPLGQIRIDYKKEEKIWIVSYLIDQLFRGQGLSVTILNLATDRLFERVLYAQTKLDNIASQRALLKAGFILVESQGERQTYKFN